LSSLLKDILQEADVRPALDAPRGVEVVVRKNGNEKYLFLLNHTDQVQFVNAGGTYLELINGDTESETVRLSPRDVKILQVVEK